MKGFLKEGRPTGFFAQPVAQACLLAGFCLFLYVVNLGCWDLWNPDEPRYAHVVREMVSRGDWVLLHFNGKVYAEKPPLFFWLIALSSFLWKGVTSFSARLPAAFFATGTVLLTWAMGRRLYSARTGFLAGLILATAGEFAYLATRVNIDAILAFFTTAALYAFLSRYLKDRDEEGRPEKMGGAAFYAFYLGMAMATLTKGPV